MIKVIIEREVKPGYESEVDGLLREFRSEAIRQQGYISGETLVSLENPYRLVVLSTWASEEDWNRWKNSPKRAALDEELSICLKGPTKYEVFGLGSAPESG